MHRVHEGREGENVKGSRDFNQEQVDHNYASGSRCLLQPISVARCEVAEPTFSDVENPESGDFPLSNSLNSAILIFRCAFSIDVR